MNADEAEVYDFLRGYPTVFVSCTEISKKVGKGRRFDQDRTWARPILRRMELDGVLEANAFGEYRIRAGGPEVNFKEALKTPGVTLGDTTIIKLDDVQA
jgi:hypothetical protein